MGLFWGEVKKIILLGAVFCAVVVDTGKAPLSTQYITENQVHPSQVGHKI